MISNLFQFPSHQGQFEADGPLPPRPRQSGTLIGLQSRTDLKYQQHYTPHFVCYVLVIIRHIEVQMIDSSRFR